MSTQSEQLTTLPEKDLIEGDEGEQTGVQEGIENSPYRSKAARRVQTQPYDYAVREHVILLERIIH